MAPPRILSLCSGIGGLELGVQLAWPGARAVGFVEREAFPAAVLLARMEEETLERAPVWCGDLRDLDARPLRGHVDLVTAGYPCQPFSCAGKREGEGDERHLWAEVARVLGEVRPSYVFLENVSAHLRVGFDTALADLARLGFDAEWTIVGADDVGAPHRRKRLFVLANARRLGLDRIQPGWRHGAGGSGAASTRGAGEGLADADRSGPEGAGPPPLWPPGPAPELWRNIPPEAQPAIRGVVDGSARGLERSRLTALGNGVVPLAAAHAFRTLLARHLST